MKNITIQIVVYLILPLLGSCSADNGEMPKIKEGAPCLNISDSLTLIKIYEALGPWDGQRWDYHDYTTWAGLKAARDVANNEIRAVGLEVYGGIHGNLPDDLCNLPELRTLILKGGSGHIPDSIGKLKHLTYLCLSDNNVTGKIPESIGRLHQLEQLRLFNSELCDTIPESIGELVNVTTIYMFNNRLCGNIPKGLAKLKKLRLAYFDNNQLSGTFPIEITRDRSAPGVWFQFRNNNITELPFEIWDDSFNGDPPYLTGNRLTGEIPEWVKQTAKWAEYKFITGRQQSGYGYTNRD